MDHVIAEGSTTFATSVLAEASSSALCSLAVDPVGLRAMEPRVREAHWLDDGPPAQARAYVVADVALSDPWLARALGEQRGIVQVVDYAPGRQVTYLCENARGAAMLRARFHDVPAGCLVHLSGWILPRHTAVRVGLRLLRPLVLVLIERSLRRTLARASSYLAAESAGVNTG